MPCSSGSRCRRTRAASSRSAPKRIGSPAPTRSAFPSRASCRSIFRSAAERPNRAQFDAWRQALPRPLATVGHFAVAGDKLRVAIPLPASVAVARPYVFPVDRRAVDYAAPQTFRRVGDTLIAELQRKGGDPRDLRACSRSATGRARVRRRARAGSGGGIRSAGRADGAALGRSRSAAGGVLLNLMPCVFPILALKALHLVARRRGRAGGARRTRWPTRPARSSAPARSASRCWRSAPRERRPAGHSSSRIRARHAAASARDGDHRQSAAACSSCRCSAAGAAGRAASAPERSPRSSRRHAPGRSSAPRSARRCCCRSRVGCWFSQRSASGLRCRSSLVAFVPRFRTGCRSPGRGCDRLQRFLAIPMAASAIAALWLLSAADGGSGAVRSALMAALSLCGAALRVGCVAAAARRLARWALVGARRASRLSAIALVPAVDRVSASPIAGAERWSEARGRRMRSQQGQPVFVYFTADWCLTLQGQRNDRHRPRRGPGRLPQGGRARCSPAIGPMAIRRSRASSKAAAAPACRFISGTRRARRPRNCRRC